MTKYREVIEQVLSEPVQVVVVDVSKEFIYLDKTSKGWKLTITKSLIPRTEDEKKRDYWDAVGISP